ncbi:RNP-1 like RNA-binding protein, partial [Conidiobolus coronatus NRRL 28638]
SKLFVGNLDWNTDKDEFQSYFSKYGDIDDVHIVTDKETGRSRGFGFVTYLCEDSADEAIKNLDNTEFKGRTIAVKIAENKAEHPRRNNGFNSGY